MKAISVIKATVAIGGAGLMTVLVLAMFFVCSLSLNSYADDGQDLIDAVKREDISSVKVLLDKGTDVNAKDEDGGTALMSASQFGYIEIAMMLLDKGAAVNTQDKVGLTALMLASLNGHTKIVKALLDKGADMNAKNKRGATALMLASQYGYTEIAKMLLDNGADLDKVADVDTKHSASPNTPSRFAVIGDCITDNLTGLMWAKSPIYSNMAWGWSSAEKLVSDLSLCGFKDWRLPTLDEFKSLYVEDHDTAGWLITQGFNNLDWSGIFWTSTSYRRPYVGTTHFACNINKIFGCSSDDRAARVWPVRKD